MLARSPNFKCPPTRPLATASPPWAGKGSDEAGRRGDDEGMRDYLLHDAADHRDHRPLLAAGQRHQRRRDHEMQHVLEAEDQRDGHRRRLAEGEQGQPRPHIADIAIGRRQSLDRRLADGRPAQPQADREDQIDGENAAGDAENDFLDDPHRGNSSDRRPIF